MKNRKVYSFISFIMAGLIFVFTSLGVVQYINNKQSLIGDKVFNPARTVFVVNDFIEKFNKGYPENLPNRSDSKENSGKRNKTGVYIINQGKISKRFILSKVFGIKVKFLPEKNSIFSLIKESMFAHSKYYLKWSCIFLTPIEMCIQSRADEFDINPIDITKRINRFSSPYFLSAGFLFLERKQNIKVRRIKNEV
ncbi:MAG: hypothetical protein ACOC5T_01535 [Elusimicrobiota bacterium]